MQAVKDRVWSQFEKLEAFMSEEENHRQVRSQREIPASLSPYSVDVLIPIFLTFARAIVRVSARFENILALQNCPASPISACIW